jgi:hypothetical protein
MFSKKTETTSQNILTNRLKALGLDPCRVIASCHCAIFVSYIFTISEKYSAINP